MSSPATFPHRSPSLNQVAPEPSDANIRQHSVCSSHAPLKRELPRKMSCSQSMQSMQSTFQSGLDRDSDEDEPSTRQDLPAHPITHSIVPLPALIMRTQANSVGAGVHKRPQSAPPERTRSRHHTRHHHTQGRETSTGARKHRGRSAGGRDNRHPWIRKLVGGLKFPLRARHAARSRRKTVNIHLEGGTNDTTSRVVEAAVETLLLDFAQFHNPIQTERLSAAASSIQSRSAIEKWPRLFNRAARKRRVAARRRLLQFMHGARLRTNRLTAEALALVPAATATRRQEDQRQVDKLHEAIDLYLQRSEATRSKQTVGDFRRSTP